MNVAKEIFNNLHTSADLIDPFGKNIKLMKMIILIVG